MKRSIYFLLLIFAVGFFTSCSQEMAGNAKKYFSAGGSSVTSLTQQNAAEGIKEALLVGIRKGSEIVSQTNGYFGNPAIKILLPPEAKDVEARLRRLGMDKEVDEAILTINRAAESAASEAKPIFIDAIKGLTIQDAVTIVKGNDDECTLYLKKTTSDKLREKFQPVIFSSLNRTGATKYWGIMMTTYNKIPFVEKINPDLPSYATQKALDGLFLMIAQEEYKIRKEPMARTSEILKNVFGR
ncbi:MAG: DUF4197 domain-containing protein [Phycisphaerae bacterium]